MSFADRTGMLLTVRCNLYPVLTIYISRGRYDMTRFLVRLFRRGAGRAGVRLRYERAKAKLHARLAAEEAQLAS